MHKKLKDLSGKEVIKFLEQNGFSIHGTRGSHCKMRRIISDHNQTIIIPTHNSIAKGTLHDIYNQISEYLPELGVEKFFYS